MKRIAPGRATFLTVLLLGTGSTCGVSAVAGPSFYPMPDTYSRAAQEISVLACVDETSCQGAVEARELVSKGDGAYVDTIMQLSTVTTGFHTAVCPVPAGAIVVRDDGGLATLNANVKVEDCYYVTQTCDDEGNCVPDFEGTISISVAIRKPLESEVESNQLKTKYADGSSGLYTCQAKKGLNHAESVVTVNGVAWHLNYSHATKRDCSGVAKYR